MQQGAPLAAREISPGHSNRTPTPGLCIAIRIAVYLGTETPRDAWPGEAHAAMRKQAASCVAFLHGAAGRDCRVGWMDGWMDGMAWHGEAWDGMGWDAGFQGCEYWATVQR